MMYVLGGRGRLGRSLAASHPAHDVAVLDRTIYENWWKAGAGSEVSRYFEKAPAGSIAVVAAGVLDPMASASLHHKVNVELPRNVMDGANNLGLRVVTFGTVMEQFVAHQNPYVQSKAELGRLVAERAAIGADVVHVQVHTLFGVGQPSPHMFLGQMLAALQDGRAFDMTLGRQLREYHHVVDDVSALEVLLAKPIRGVVALSHGEPCTLRDIAIHIFERLKRIDLLRLGARPEPPDDNFSTTLARPEWLEAVTFRPTLPAVADYMQSFFPNPRHA